MAAELVATAPKSPPTDSPDDAATTAAHQTETGEELASPFAAHAAGEFTAEPGPVAAHQQPAPSSTKLPSTADLINKNFRAKSGEPPQGANLAFDFSDEPAPAAAPQAASDTTGADNPEPDIPRRIIRWEVGDDFEPAAPDPRSEGFRIGTAPAGGAGLKPSGATEDADDDFIDEATAPIYNRGVAHSSRLFLALFALVAAGFTAAMLTIHNAPAAALALCNRLPMVGERFTQPIAPAQMVALRNVRASYQSSKDGRPALVIEGEGENLSATSLHTIQITARLATARGAVQRQAYCGNNLTAEIGQMTAHEIAFFQGQPPLKDFALETAARSRFVIVFLDPPATARDFALAVTRAQPFEADATAGS
ncbi:MAG: hypothetical protein ACREQC_15945 [Candidatus Binataceae bacterium]